MRDLFEFDQTLKRFVLIREMINLAFPNTYNSNQTKGAAHLVLSIDRPYPDRLPDRHFEHPYPDRPTFGSRASLADRSG